ncbi:inner nuclear membrane protein enriched at telomere/subtelomere region [Lithohypha guttulata]|uniref:Inner nuclear membrane protein enriched at telomere/subtelomere region n=1 Tax=Lithohypha guttulata TaxID=1690604 RepID=A0AAN7SWL0_9EURO|nr:inner nuclear membrane protein enriched at telomere/subtelomere region [Lithohypha guttulata]
MADDELYYLQPGFDLNTLTIPRLRQILVAHDINYPSSAKKSDLVSIVTRDLLPQSRKLLRERDRVRRTSRGITDVPSSQEGSTVDDYGDEREQMLPPAPKTPRSRKSKSQLVQEEVEPTPKTSRRSKTPSTRRSTNAPAISEAETTETEQERAPRSVKRTRKSIPTPDPAVKTPGVRLQDATDTRRALEADESPFTQDNPFQSGSSPPSESRRVPSSSRTRKSLGTSKTRKSTSRRRTSPTTIKRESIEFPVSHLSTGVDGVETTEEFTEDARQELSQEMAANRKLVKARTKDVKKLQKRPPSTAAKAAPWTVLVTVLGTVAAWYRQEKVAVGYCGVGQPQWSLVNVEAIPSWLHENFQPECEPCPQHASCYPDMKAHCDHDFVLRQHPLSFNGLIPFPPTCEPDSEKERRIHSVADRATELLRDRRATYECGGDLSTTTSGTTSASSVTVVSPAKLEISEEALKETLSKQKRKGMSNDEFEDLWNSALTEIKARNEIEVTHDKSGRTLLSSNSFANLPFTCAIRRSAIRALAANRIPIFLLITIVSGAFYAYRHLQQFQAAKTQTPQLVEMTLDRLATQAALHEDGRVSEAYLAVGQLRDDVLRNVFSRAERERTWERVRKVVEANSNVRAATREGKTGEWSRVWEWIGPVNFVPGLEGRKSGGLIGSSPATASRESTPPVTNGRVTDREFRKWDEGRAIY